MAGEVFVGGGATVVMNPPSVIYVQAFHPGSGPDRHLKRKTVGVMLTAKVLAPRRTGALAASVGMTQNRDEKGQYSFGYKVFAGTDYGYYVHEGTRPSPRWPSNRKVMKWPGYDGPVYRDFVMHPGTPAVPFLRDALVAMVD